ncbi:general secretion pathway protein K (plasmid) [Legionella adelaidensis]|uniref:Type II secretion system protein K n=1 Tax=Legionella adelaidensis TaxID=45056 RepID=A0A0W0R490_9GAMM|nr:type II secretion system minor pseudopilin GspK [Legionella adelaidensis]KTC65852.1 type II secretory pathway protein [Legionella adelaidensis]VEH85282.1 general secretion pathway protein K [Legionella adelaidensis]
MQRKSQGSALLTALFIMTLVAIAATAMSMRLQLDIYRTQLTTTHDKMYLATQGVLFWALDKLGQKKMFFSSSIVPPPNFLTDYSEFKVTGEIIDLQAKFNLNNVQDKKYQTFFLQLLKNIAVPINSSQQKTLSAALTHWVSPYRLDKGKDPFLDYYLAQKPPYLPSNLPLQNISEFRLIADVTPALYQSLEPWVTALPEVTSININTAPKQVLMALGNGIDDATAKEIIKAREEKGIDNLQSITPLLKRSDIPIEQITLESQYFLVVANVKFQDTILISYTVVKRARDNKGKVSVGVVMESLNTV